MATRKPPSTTRADLLPGEAELARAYRDTAQETPPASLDAKILAAARAAVARPKARSPFRSQWAIPLSAAAVMVLSLGVVLLFREQGVFDRYDRPVPAEAPSFSAAPTVPATPQAPASAAAPARLAEVPDMAMSKPPAASGAEAEQTRNAERKSALTALKPGTSVEEARARGPENRERRAAGILAQTADGVSRSAEVISVQASGQPGAYQFLVGIRSPDTGCKQYADWWEVVGADGKLLYRQVLRHSHADEQPFVGAGGPVPIQSDTVVWVRAHMNTGGYGGVAFKGSVQDGFQQTALGADFAAALAAQPPLPDSCDF